MDDKRAIHSNTQKVDISYPPGLYVRQDKSTIIKPLRIADNTISVHISKTSFTISDPTCILAKFLARGFP
jgi:hypothetical protein